MLDDHAANAVALPCRPPHHSFDPSSGWPGGAGRRFPRPQGNQKRPVQPQDRISVAARKAVFEPFSLAGRVIPRPNGAVTAKIPGDFFANSLTRAAGVEGTRMHSGLKAALFGVLPVLRDCCGPFLTSDPAT